MYQKNNNFEAGADETPAIKNSPALYSYAPNLYINTDSPDDELTLLKNNPLIQDFANVDSDIYELVAVTNPTLKLFFDLAKRICEVKA